jgi:four helix bundle protein
MSNEKQAMTNVKRPAAEARGDDIARRLLSFAVRVGKIVDQLPETRLGRHIAAQLVRCATSPASNYEEARAAESRNDFVHKLSICLKELREARVWLLMISDAALLPESRLRDIIDEAEQLAKIIGRSRLTAKSNSKML